MNADAHQTMLRNPPTEVQRKRRALPYGLYLLIMAIFWAPYSQQLNADGVSYLSIAAEYAKGQWWTAVNTYWSPLFSWLLALGIAFKAPPLPVARLLTALFGLLGLLAFRRLLSIFDLHPDIAGVAMIAAVPMFCYFGLHDVTPDVMALGLLEVYLSFTCAKDITMTQWRYAGALGALLYLAKAYCFVFVIAHLVVTGGIRLYASSNAESRWKLARGCGSAVIILLLLCAPWLTLIGIKAGQPTLSTAGAYNFKRALTGNGDHPMLSQGLFAPPNPQAVSIWEKPDAMPVRLPSGSSVVSRLGRAITRNLAAFARYELWASILLPAIVAVFAYQCFERWRAGRPDVSAGCVLATYAIFPAGYLLTYVEHRYIWIEDVLALAMAACLFDWLRAAARIPRQWLPAAGIAIAVSFCCAPLFIVIKHSKELHAISDLIPVLEQLRLSGNLASNGRWDETQYLAYRLGLRYYGIPAQGSAGGNEEEMLRDGMRYVFVWHVEGAPLPPRPGKELLRSRLMDVYAIPHE